MTSSSILLLINTLRPRQDGRHFPDDILKYIFLSENVWIPIIISLKFVPKGPISNIPALVRIMAWRRPDDKPLSEPMMVSLLTHICVTRPQWVKMDPSLFYMTTSWHENALHIIGHLWELSIGQVLGQLRKGQWCGSLIFGGVSRDKLLYKLLICWFFQIPIMLSDSYCNNTNHRFLHSMCQTKLLIANEMLLNWWFKNSLFNTYMLTG